MKIFKQEMKDGLRDLLSNSTIAYQSKLTLNKNPTDEQINGLFKSNAFNLNQPDLAYLETILASTGWNLNDDIFISSEMWKAKDSPVDKKLNVEHDEDDIVGHITGSYVISGKDIITSSATIIPDSFDIVTAAVIYKMWRKEQNNARIEKILAEIDEGLWFVSMECLFPNFDYGIIVPGGGSIILERSESTSYLTKHLRIYGGSGEYEGHKLGRVLRDFTFSGKGLVSNPANPRSIILKSTASFDAPKQKQQFSISEKKNMNEELLKEQLKSNENKLNDALSELKAVKSELERVKAEELKNKEEAIKASSEAKDKTIAELQSKIDEFAKTLAEKDKSIASVNNELADVKAELESKETELNKIALASKEANRLSKLVEAGLEKTQAESSVKLYEALSDENFDKIVETIKSVAKKDEMKDDKKKQDEKKKSEDKKDAKANAETFNDTKGEASPGSNETDDKQSKLKVSLASWLSESIGLKTEKGE
jgi:hypothetical protein